jgi:Protein of unknown function (DUF3303)
MLFHVTWDFTDSSEDGQRQVLELFSKWQPGPGQFQGFYGFADGAGGVALIEAESAPTLARTLAPWTPWMEFQARAILTIQESAQINAEAAAWRSQNS